MVNFGKHGIKVPGVVEFAAWLESVPGTAKVLGGNFRTRKVSPGHRDPKFRALRHCVEVQYYNSGMMMLMRVFPQKVVTATDLYHRLERAWVKRQERGAPGMRPTDPVVLPDSVRHHCPPSAPTPPSAAPVTPPPPPEPPMSVPAETPTVVSKIYELSPDQAKVYDYLLSLDPRGQLEFTVDGIFGKVKRGMTIDQGQASSLISILKRKGLVVAIDYVTTGFAPQKRYRVLRRPYQIVTTHTTARPSDKRSPKAPTAPSAPRTSADALEDHLRFFTKHQAVLTEGDERRKALAKRGYEIVMIKGRLALVQK